jgi:hypothetical protein
MRVKTGRNNVSKSTQGFREYGVFWECRERTAGMGEMEARRGGLDKGDTCSDPC